MCLWLLKQRSGSRTRLACTRRESILTTSASWLPPFISERLGITPMCVYPSVPRSCDQGGARVYWKVNEFYKLLTGTNMPRVTNITTINYQWYNMHVNYIEEVWRGYDLFSMYFNRSIIILDSLNTNFTKSYFPDTLHNTDESSAN